LCSDAYKEFEKEIQEDLQEVDGGLEEEEVRLIYILHYMLTVKKIFTYPLPMFFFFGKTQESCVSLYYRDET